MANTTIKFKRSSVPNQVPTVSDLDFGEIAINVYSGKIYTKKNDGNSISVVDVGGPTYTAGAGIAIDPSNIISTTVASSGPAGRLQSSNGAGGFTALPSGSVGQVLTSNGTTATWSTPVTGVTSVAVSGGSTGLTTSGGPITGSGTITLGGVLGIAAGGTGATTQAAALTALLPSQTGNAGYVLTSNGTNATWQAAAGGGVTSVAASGGTTGLTFSGSPILTSGTLTLGGTLGVSNGGTGATSAAAALTALLPVQTGQTGFVLTTNGTTASWAAPTGGVSSVNVSGGSTGLAFTGGPITSSGTMTMSGVLAVANGGTGANTTAGLIAAALPSQSGNNGRYLSTDGTTASWQPVTSSPGGSSTQVQYNVGGVFTGDANFTYNASTLSVPNLAVSTTSTLASVNTSGRYTSNVVDVAASAIDCSASNYFRKTASGALTWTFTNPPPNNRAYIMVLRLQNGGTGLQTWPASVVWPGGTAPTLTASGYDLLLFETDNGGTSWRGAALINYSS